MVEATLAFVRDAAGREARVPLELGSLIESVADDLASTGHNVSADGGERLILTGDPTALRRLASNLLVNAHKYGGRGVARTRRDGPDAVIEVEDEGPGLPPEDLERMFDPFVRGEASRNRDTGGIGLGLAVVRTIARAHGGEARLENRESGGLRAIVRLPLDP